MTQTTIPAEKTNVDQPPAYDTSSDQLELLLTPDINSDDVLVTLTPPRDGKRMPVDICCVIDVSGSMDTPATIPTEPGKPAESTNLSILDIVRHAMRTIIVNMQPEDRIAVVTFSQAGRKRIDFTFTDEKGKKSVIDVVEKMQTEGSTNLWDGLKVGMNVMNGRDMEKSSGRLASIFLLTDGMPNVEPPRGHIPMLKSYLDSHPESNFLINTFGFGYDLDSRLLVEIAEIGNGTYGFIPDSGMVGTVFVHAVANTFTTYAADCSLWVETAADSPVRVIGADETLGSHIDMGTLQFGQTRDIVMRLQGYKSSPQDVLATFTVQYRPCSLPANAEKLLTSCKLAREMLGGVQADNLALLKHHTFRLEFVAATRALYPQQPEGNARRSVSVPAGSVERFQGIHTAIKQTPVLSTYRPSLHLSEDISGQVLLAITKEAFFRRWGRHYLPSLSRAHERQQCNNFKDPGIQEYGSKSPLFIKARNELDASFDNLPPPTPSKRKTSYNYGGSSHGGSAPISMSSWNMSSAPCFHEDCHVRLSSGEDMELRRLRRGIVLSTPAGPRRVAALIRTEIPSGTLALCSIGKLKITPWHPVLDVHTRSWRFPSHIIPPETVPCKAVYSVLLEPDINSTAHAVYIENVQCVTLGHGILSTRGTASDPRAHSFFGNYEKVLRSVANLPGFTDTEGVLACAGTHVGPYGVVDGFLAVPQASESVVMGAETAFVATS